MSVTDSPGTGNGRGGVKTLAIRLEPEIHAQLFLIAQLRESTITDEIRTAIEAHIAGAKVAPELAARAGSVLDDIEREAVARRAAIATLFGTTPAAVNTTTGGASDADAPAELALMPAETAAAPDTEPEANNPRPVTPIRGRSRKDSVAASTSNSTTAGD